MILPSSQPFLKETLERRLFTRRIDLSNNIRLAIATDALHAMANGSWGTITNIANKYAISRTFIYSLANGLKEVGEFLFGEKTNHLPAIAAKEYAIQMMLSFRMEVIGSIAGVSTAMKRLKSPLSSTGAISETLSRIGGSLSMTVDSKESIQYLVFASDEIFSKNIPILVTVDPCSSAILRIELSKTRNAEDWKNHFDCLKNNGVEAIYLVSDDGSGLRAGHAEGLSETVRQSDTYHAVAHNLGSWADRIETAAYAAIKKECECERTLASAKSDQVKNKRRESYDKAVKNAAQAIMLYDDFYYLYRCIISELHVFDADGNLRHRQQAEGGIEMGLTLMDELNHAAVSRAVNKVRRTLPDLFHYFDRAETLVNECKALKIDEDTLKAYCIAWQWGKAVRKAKKSKRKQQAKQQERICLETANWLHQQGVEDEGWDKDIQKVIYSKLDQIIQSSALVECINSIIRPYFNTSKNNVSQHQLNLIMHYHNHRRYLDGVRKGRTPMEILTGKDNQKDWIEVLFDIIREKDPELLMAS